jgi:hypothetical protein
MKLMKTLFWVGAGATAFPMVKKLLARRNTGASAHMNSYVPAVEKTIEKHAGEESQIVQAFAHAVEDAKHSAP